MLGLYDRTPRRLKLDLNGWWELALDPQERGVALAYFRRFPTEGVRPAWVPGCWNTEPGLMLYQGVAWYRRVFASAEEGRALLTFGAVAETARVWLNGDYLGAHVGGFTAFTFSVALRAGENELVVRADNRHSATTLPKDEVDWFPYGGIPREVVLERVGACTVTRLHLRGQRDGQVEARATLRNDGDSPATWPLQLRLEGALVAERSVTLAAGEERVECLHATIAAPRPWSPADPHLYQARVSWGDEQVARFGLREVRTRGAEILLNGEPLWLRGVNRHEDHPDWGLSIPEKLMRRDVQIIQSLGCNAVRGSHYPNHPTFLDLCDEAGLLFFAEVPGWQYSAHQLATSPTRELLAQTLQEMIAEQFNHPCIFTWSLHNECDTDVERLGEADVASATRALYALARSLDETRLITHVSHRFWHDRYFDLADLVCLNEYIGWYVEHIEGADLPAYLRRMAALCPDKPILITEFGAEGLAGYHSLEGIKWSEEHQTAQLRDSIAAFAANNHVAGCFVWQYCDVNVHPGRSMRRARSLNNKGVVDEYRRPKMAYFAVREAFQGLRR